MGTKKKTPKPAAAKGRTPDYRSADPRMAEKMAAWDAETRTWIREQAMTVFNEAEPTADITAGDVLARLDRMDNMPVGFARYIEPELYDRRYQMVRTQLERMEREGHLEMGTTVNARGREDVRCYRRAPYAAWRVEVEPDVPAAREALEACLRQCRHLLKHVDVVLISRQHLGASPGGIVKYGDQGRGEA